MKKNATFIGPKGKNTTNIGSIIQHFGRSKENKQRKLSLPFERNHIYGNSSCVKRSKRLDRDQSDWRVKTAMAQEVLPL